MKRGKAAEFLEKAPDHGLPDDYLLSRLKGRRSHLVMDWEAIGKSASPLEQLPDGHYQRVFGVRTPEAIWRALLIEYRWVYHQMNGQLRETFAPFSSMESSGPFSSVSDT